MGLVNFDNFFVVQFDQMSNKKDQMSQPHVFNHKFERDKIHAHTRLQTIFE